MKGSDSVPRPLGDYIGRSEPENESFGKLKCLHTRSVFLTIFYVFQDRGVNYLASVFTVPINIYLYILLFQGFSPATALELCLIRGLKKTTLVASFFFFFCQFLTNLNQ